MTKGIFIPNVEMPRVCHKCFAFHYEWGDYDPDVYCEITGEELEDATKRGDECPLVEMSEQPKMNDDLISRAEAIEALGEEPLVWCDEDYEIAERDQWRADIEAIKSVPSAERPRGRWHYSDGKPATIGQSFGVICDQRGAESEYCTNFCPNCGAKMDGERSEE